MDAMLDGNRRIKRSYFEVAKAEEEELGQVQGQIGNRGGLSEVAEKTSYIQKGNWKQCEYSQNCGGQGNNESWKEKSKPGRLTVLNTG